MRCRSEAGQLTDGGVHIVVAGEHDRLLSLGGRHLEYACSRVVLSDEDTMLGCGGCKEVEMWVLGWKVDLDLCTEVREP